MTGAHSQQQRDHVKLVRATRRNGDRKRSETTRGSEIDIGSRVVHKPPHQLEVAVAAGQVNRRSADEGIQHRVDVRP